MTSWLENPDFIRNMANMGVFYKSEFAEDENILLYDSTSVNKQQRTLTNFEFNYDIPGFGEQNKEQCGAVVHIEYCPDCGTVKPRAYRCKKWTCPVCWEAAVKQAADRCADRLNGVWFAYNKQGVNLSRTTNYRFVGVMLSPPPSEFASFDLERERKRVIQYASEIGVLGGVVVYHPYRIKQGIQHELYTMEAMEQRHINKYKAARGDLLGLGGPGEYFHFSPHFHIIGFMPEVKIKSDEFKRKTGWLYSSRSMKDVDDVYRLSYDLFSHQLIPKKGYSYRYFGVASYNATSVLKIVSYKQKTCPKCDSDKYCLLTGSLERANKIKCKIEVPDNFELDRPVVYKHVRKFYECTRRKDGSLRGLPRNYVIPIRVISEMTPISVNSSSGSYAVM